MSEFEKMQNQFSYELEYWNGTTGFEPVALVATEDNSGSYEMSRLHVFQLKRGYAIVSEQGCSCYSASDADIDIHPDLDSVKTSLKNAADRNSGYSYGDLAKSILTQLMGK